MNLYRQLLDCFWFGGPAIDRKNYVLKGTLLIVLKYLVEFVVIANSTGKTYSPVDFFNPLLTGRARFLEAMPSWVAIAWVVWTVLFLAIAMAMTGRRAIHAGQSPWAALWILVPVANFLAIGYFATARSKPADARSPQSTPRVAGDPRFESDLLSVLIAIFAGSIYLLALTLFCNYLLGDYGAALFMGAPTVVGTVAGYLANMKHPRSLGATFWVALVSVVLPMGVMIALGWEGLICLVMATPIFLPLALIGACCGHAIAARRYRHDENGLAGALLILPVLALVEHQLPDPPERCVQTSVVVQASVQEVWDTVIAFPPIDSPEPWYFRLGIASPQSARLVGEGVGAVRYCEFTTGSFVEPITTWDEPRHLAFDVTEQPEPMFELSPYRNIHPPHLDGALQSNRGEFVLEPLGDGRTRLIGRTYYQLRMAPLAYWAIWSDELIHRIHRRVLDHIAVVAESV